MGIDLSRPQRNDMSDSAWPLFTRGRVNQVRPFATHASTQQMPRKRGSTMLLAPRTLRQVVAATSADGLRAARGLQDGRAFVGEGSDEGSKSTTRQCLYCVRLRRAATPWWLSKRTMA
jgi:hypothetical protein